MKNVSALSSVADGSINRALAIRPSADHLDAITRIITRQELVIGCQARLAHTAARILVVFVILVESKPIILAVERISVVSPIFSAKVISFKNPKVHHNLGGFFWNLSWLL